MSRRIINSFGNKNNRISLITIFIPILVGLIVMYKSTQIYELYHITIEILTTTIAFSLSMISFAKHGDEDYSIFNYIGIGFTFIAIATTIHIIFLLAPNLASGDYSYDFNIWTYITLFESLIVTFSFFLKYKKVQFNYTWIFYGVFSIVLIVLIYIISIYYYGNKEFLYDAFVNTVLIINIINIILLLINGRGYRKKEVLIFCIYLMGLLSSLYLYKLTVNSYIDELLGLHIIKYINYYLLYIGVQEFTLKRTYKRMRDDLIDTTEKQRRINRTLNERTKMLKEIDLMVSKSERRYKQLVESIADTILIFNKGKLIHYNEGIFNIIGEQEKVLFENKSIESIFRSLKLDYREIRQELYIKDFNFITKKNKKLELQLFLFRIDKNIEIVFIQNNTEVNFNSRLKNRLTAYLREENLKKQFFSNISHELRTPINLIYSAIQLNDIYINDNQISNINKNNEIIKQNCLRLIRTINNFIDANKISEGYLQSNKDIYNIVDIVEDVSQASYRYMQKQNINMIFDADEEEIFVKCDYIQIQRIMLNLLSNSVKYGKDGTTIWVNVFSQGEVVTISVKNDGYAIPESIQPFLFDKFTKINKAFNREKEGSGLGLYLTKGLIELQGGSITINSKEGEGTEFDIYLPKWSGTIDYDDVNIAEINDLDEKVDIEFSDIYI